MVSAILHVLKNWGRGYCSEGVRINTAGPLLEQEGEGVPCRNKTGGDTTVRDALTQDASVSAPHIIDRRRGMYQHTQYHRTRKQHETKGGGDITPCLAPHTTPTRKGQHTCHVQHVGLTSAAWLGTETERTGQSATSADSQSIIFLSLHQVTTLGNLITWSPSPAIRRLS